MKDRKKILCDHCRFGDRNAGAVDRQPAQGGGSPARRRPSRAISSMLHLIKEPTGNGTYRYAVSTQKMRLNLADRLQTILRESIVSVDCAQNLVLIKTMRASAPRQAPPLTAWRSPPSSARSAATTRCSIVLRENEPPSRALLGDRGHAETAPDQVRTKFCRRMSDA